MTWKMRKGAAFAARDTASTSAPGPLIVMFLLITSSPLVRLIAPVTANVIVSPSFTSASACRNEPGPLSLVFVTTMVSACAGIATAKSNVTAVAADLTLNVILIFIQLLLTTKEQ